MDGLTTSKISDKCKKIIFSSKTSLKEKVRALESLFIENKIKRIDNILTKYGSGSKPSGSRAKIVYNKTVYQENFVSKNKHTASTPMIRGNFRNISNVKRTPTTGFKNHPEPNQFQSLANGYEIGKCPFPTQFLTPNYS